MLKYRTTDGQVIDTQKLAAHFVELNQGIVDWLLAMNSHNRALKNAVVALYAKRMTEGEFVLTNQGIGVVANNGRPFLADGQHRLMGWVEAGGPKGIHVLLVTGLHDSAQVFVDAGKNRSYADMLALLLDQKVGTRVIAVARLLMSVRITDTGFHFEQKVARQASPYEVAELIESRLSPFGDLLRVCQNLRAPAVAAIVEYAERFSPLAAMQFAVQVADGEGLNKRDPAYRLRDYLQNHKFAGGTSQKDCYARTVSAVCAHAREQQLASLYAATQWSLPAQRRLTA